ncbi:MAG TPA: hypothetical protein ENJ16_02465 [Planctomycetaceae bacterium]|nr:hypothetical protein [Planctomycetaceae bacterium]
MLLLGTGASDTAPRGESVSRGDSRFDDEVDSDVVPTEAPSTGANRVPHRTQHTAEALSGDEAAGTSCWQVRHHMRVPFRRKSPDLSRRTNGAPSTLVIGIGTLGVKL